VSAPAAGRIMMMPLRCAFGPVRGRRGPPGRVVGRTRGRRSWAIVPERDADGERGGRGGRGRADEGAEESAASSGAGSTRRASADAVRRAHRARKYEQGVRDRARRERVVGGDGESTVYEEEEEEEERSDERRGRITTSSSSSSFPSSHAKDDADADAATAMEVRRAMQAGDADGVVRALRRSALSGGGGEAVKERRRVSRRLERELRATHKKFIQSCASQRRMDAALEYARLFESKHVTETSPAADLYCGVISACGRARDWNTAWAAFECRRDEGGVEPDAYAYSMLISTAGKCGNLKAAREAFAEANRVEAVDTVLYNSFIDVCAARGDYDGARGTLERMKRVDGLMANIRSYNGVISASTRQKNFLGALWAWNEINAQSLEPTAHTYGAMLAAGAAAKETSVDWSIEMFDRALASGVCGRAGNNHMVSSMLSAYAHGVARGQIGREAAMEGGEKLVENLIEDAKGDERLSASTPNARVWCALITLCAKCGRSARAIEVLNIMNAKMGARAGEHLEYALTAALGASKEGPEHFARMLEVLERMPANIRHSTGVSNALIATYLHFSDFKAAFRVYGEMKRKMHALRRGEAGNVSNEIPDTITYNTLITACATNGEDEKALQLYRDMKTNGVPPSLRTYVGLITSLSRARGGSRVEEAEKFFNIAIDDGIVPNEFLFTTLMDAQVKAELPMDAFATYGRMLDAGVQCTAVTFGCALHACWVCDDAEEGVERAYTILRDMTERDVKMNDWCSNAFVRVISRADRIEEMLEEVKKIVRRKGTLEGETLEAVIRALCREGFVERAKRFLSIMESKGLEATEETLESFVVAASREGFVDMSWEMYKKFTRLGHKLSIHSRSALVAMLSVASTSPDPDDGELLLSRAIGVIEGALKLSGADADGADQVIDTEARCALIVALARGDRLDLALSMWRRTPNLSSNAEASAVTARKHTSSDSKDYIGDGSAVYESLIEMCCHENRIEDALDVFDALKDTKLRVSTVTLAFLESSCRRSRVEEWRIFDVCAHMRAQADQKLAGRLARPSKRSHHVRDDDANDIASELTTKGLGGEQITSSWRRGDARGP
jgi:pentatricopeptide repeat protein